VAEYVENEEIARKLAQIGVAFGQGYFLAKPRPWEQLFEPS
jgi:EAL domain-containing protein (putative c-di-GMP-specific phosphodiesterase class I)